MKALLEAGANPNSRGLCQDTPLVYAAAGGGHLEAVRVLRANADPVLAVVEEPGGRAAQKFYAPLDLAAMGGHADVVRELILQVGVDGCGGESRGAQALGLAAANCFSNCADVMAILTAGVVDTGEALCNAARRGNEEAVRFLLQRHQQSKKTWEAIVVGWLTSTPKSPPMGRRCRLR